MIIYILSDFALDMSNNNIYDWYKYAQIATV